MGRRYRKKNNSITSVVGDVVHFAAKLPWWSALLTGFVFYLVIAVLLGGYIESLIAAQQGSKIYPLVEARLGRMVRVFDWVGIACVLVGIFFSVRNYFFRRRAGRTEKGAVTLLSKLFGRELD